MTFSKPSRQRGSLSSLDSFLFLFLEMIARCNQQSALIIASLILFQSSYSHGLTSHTRSSTNPLVTTSIRKRASDQSRFHKRRPFEPSYLSVLPPSRSKTESQINDNSTDSISHIAVTAIEEANDGELETMNQKDNHKAILISSAIAYLGSTITLAKTNILGPYTTDFIYRDVGASILCTILALIFVKSITRLANQNILEPRDSRKLIHTFSAPLFILTWPLFSSLWGSRFFAAFVPFLQAIKLYMAATNTGAEDRELAGAISRSGDTSEALGGPFIYVVILFSVIVTIWLDNFSGVMALSAMAAGDGLADIVGRRFGKTNKWTFCPDKSIAGSMAFLVGSSVCSIALAAWLMFTGSIVTTASLSTLAPKFILISAISTMVELIPSGDDNWSVPISAAALSMVLL